MPGILSVAGIGVITWRWKGLRGTTLVAPAIWTIVVLAILPIVEDISDSNTFKGTSPGWVTALRAMAAMATFCPAMALFGAKRPQATAWQFIVFSLWIVLCLSAFRAFLLDDGSQPVFHSAQSWFLVILWAMTASNYLPTRYALQSLLAALGQLVLLSEFLPLADRWPFAQGIHYSHFPLATALIVSAIIWVGSGWPAPRDRIIPLDRLWLDFRDAFGAVWGLRVQQRVNQSAAMYGWKLRLDWHGFTTLEGDAIPPETEKLVRDNLKNLLRRFVSPAWIAQRVD